MFRSNSLRNWATQNRDRQRWNETNWRMLGHTKTKLFTSTLDYGKEKKGVSGHITKMSQIRKKESSHHMPRRFNRAIIAGLIAIDFHFTYHHFRQERQGCTKILKKSLPSTIVGEHKISHFAKFSHHLLNIKKHWLQKLLCFQLEG